MKPNLPLSRRDVAVIVTSVILGAQVLFCLLRLVTGIVLWRFPVFGTTPSSRFDATLLLCQLVLLGLLPFVRVIAAGVAGRNADSPLTRHFLVRLVVCSLGLCLCLVSLPLVIFGAYIQFVGNSAGGSRISIIPAYFVSHIAQLFVGVILAFFPSVTFLLTGRVRHENSSAPSVNFNVALSRRDVAALIIYVVLGHNVLSSSLSVVSQFFIARVVGLQSYPAMTNESLFTLSANLVFSLAFLPFVSMIAAGATGRKAAQVVAKDNSRSLVFACIGLMMFLVSFPQFGQGIFHYLGLGNLYGRSATTLRPYFLQSLFSTLCCVSVGFALAFFSAIFDSLSARAQEEESAA